MNSRKLGGLIALALSNSVCPFAWAGPGEDRSVPELRGTVSDNGGRLRLITLIPLLWTSSVRGADNDGGGDEQRDWHVMPNVSLNWSKQYDGVWVSQSAGLELDRYLDVSSADANIIETETLVALTNGKSDVFVPYLRYAFTSYFERNFESLNDRRHDIWAGITSDFGFRGGQTIAYRDANKPGDATAGLDVYGGRRDANNESARHWVTGAKITLGYIVNDDLEVTLAPGVRVRWYDDEPGLPDRTDVRFAAIAKAIWTPKWLTEHIPNSKLVFSAEYQNNQSSDDQAEYEYWELGPTLALQTKF